MTFLQHVYNTFLLAVPLALLLVTTTAEANTIVRSGQTVSVSEDQSVAGDFYVAAGTLNMSGVVEEDALFTGGQITINGVINESAFLVGGNVDVYGSVGDDLRVVGGNVTIAEPITGDVFVVGGSVNILSSASIGGDLLVYAGEVVIEGSVGGEVLGAVNSLRIDSFVANDVDVRVNYLVLGSKADVGGSLTYDSYNQLDRASDSNVAGEIIRNDPIIPADDSSPLSFLIPSLIILFSALSWYLVSKKTLNLVVDRAISKSPRQILIGFVTFFFMPVAAIILIFSIIGTLIGFAMLAGYILLLLLAFIMLPVLVGQLLMKAFTKSANKVSLLSIVIGVFVMALLSQLPLLGEILTLGLVFVGVGALVDTIHKPKS